MCERNGSDYSESCSECDFDDWVYFHTDSSDDDMEDSTRGVTDSRESPKFEDKEKKENCGHYISGCKIIAK